jgi:competence protein ComEA
MPILVYYPIARETKRDLMMMLRLFMLLSVLFSPFVQAGESVDINRADAVQIASALEGIGQKKAEKIVAWRKEHGAFNSIDDLGKVTGIGGKLAARNKDYVQFSSQGANHAYSPDTKFAQEKGVLSLPVGAYSAR